MDFLNLFENCHLCPRDCGVNRLKEGKSGHSGFCRESHHLRVAYVGPHFGEEPPITGKNGSGTIFFTGCSLQCSFCQNRQISRYGLGKDMDMDELSGRVVEMIDENHVHNINLVTPDHFFPHAFKLVSLLRPKGYNLPFVYNLSGYQSVAMLRMVEDFADIYLPDFKYADPTLSMGLSKCKDYPRVALEAIVEMVRQKGFLDVFENSSELAKEGVLVRHLILPGQVENSLKALTTLFLEFGSRLPLSLMSQYHPVPPQQIGDLNRSLSQEEFDKVYSHAMDLGFVHLFVQFLDQTPTSRSDHCHFLPDFRQEQPFQSKPPIIDIGNGDC
ncbi:MAG: radical SAM protein [Deltaproteobacteria bacterium]|nr:MAG: radical SAM protein [Deltaproteobacteria bacterium]